MRNTDTKKILISMAKFVPKQTFFLQSDFTPFISKSYQNWDHSFRLLFSQDYKSLKMLDIQLWEVEKKLFKRYLKKWTDGWMFTRTDGRTNPLIESIGPEGRCFKNQTCKIERRLKKKNIWHSLRLNSEVVTRAWQILGSFVVGVKMILQVVILFLYVPCKNHTKKMEKMSKINPVVALH